MQSQSLMQSSFISIRKASYSPMPMLSLAQREGEDAHLCGLTRSLHRRLLALNVPGSLRRERKPLTSITLYQQPEKRIA